MTQKAFANTLLRKLDVNPDKYIIDIYSDKHKDGTKILRIKTTRNYTGKSFEECTNILTNYLANIPNIVHVVVREPVGYSWACLKFVIQVEYVGELPDLDNPRLIEDSPKVETKSNPDGSGTIVTEFGIGYYENEADKAKLLLWLEGVKAGIAYTNAINPFDSPESEEVDPEDDFINELNSIVADSGYNWWTRAQEIADGYGLDEDTKDQIMREAFKDWCNKD